MIWQFGELGYDISIEQNGRTGEKPIKWDYLTDPYRHRLFTTYKLLNTLRKTQPVFSTANYSASLSGTMKRIQLTGTSMTAIILGNFGITQSLINPAFTKTGKWHEYFSGDSINVSDVNANFNFQPGEFRLYTTARLPSAKLILGINDDILPAKENFVTVFPNPSGDKFNFLIQDDIPASVTITIFDMTGRMIRQIKTETSGFEMIQWDAKTGNGSEAPEGIYIVQFRCGLRTQTIKIIKN
jgi:hypothetical protein